MLVLSLVLLLSSPVVKAYTVPVFQNCGTSPGGDKAGPPREKVTFDKSTSLDIEILPSFVCLINKALKESYNPLEHAKNVECPKANLYVRAYIIAYIIFSIYKKTLSISAPALLLLPLNPLYRSLTFADPKTEGDFFPRIFGELEFVQTIISQIVLI